MKASLQTAAMDPKTGTIDMDLITTGRSANARDMSNRLAGILREKFLARSGSSVAFVDLQREVQDDAGMEISASELRDAVAHLEREGAVRTTRNSVHIN